MKQAGTLVLAFIVIAALGGFLIFSVQRSRHLTEISEETFEDCVAAGNPVMESYPRQCRTADGRTLVEYIGNELEKLDVIRVSNPRPNQEIAGDLEIEGEARDIWYFEASFPIRLFDANNNEIAVAIAQAQSDLMTQDFVPFKATLEFEKPITQTGTLVFQKDGESDKADFLIMPVRFQ